MHPGHLMHSSTVVLLQSLSNELSRSQNCKTDVDRPKRIYVSRSDARSRRIINEEGVRELLLKYEFTVVELSLLPVEKQISLMMGADIVVGPHGMGLTHLAFNRRAPTLVELFHPEIGTDAYGMMAKALGFRYEYIVGTKDENSNFSVCLGVLEEKILECV